MAKYANLIAAIKAAIKTNGTQAITGQVLQNQLTAMVSKLGAAYQFGGLVQPADAFPADYSDVNVAFLACTQGKYPAFGNFSLRSGEVALFIYEGTWKKEIISYYANTQIYGIRHFFNNASPDLTRIGDADLHRDLPVQSLMRRCVVDDSGAVKYYLGTDDSTKKEDGTAAVLNGNDGQVMVEIPAHYRKCSLNTDGGYMDVEISLYPFEGAVHIPRYLVSAYEATLDRDDNKLASVKSSAAKYRGGNNNADWDGTYRDLRGLPATNISLTNFRTYGRNRGTGWGCYDYNAHLAIYWLFCIEYATLNSQKAFNADLDINGYHQGGLGAGVTDINSTAWNTYNSYYPFIPCGITNSLGNKTGVVTFEFSEAQAEAYGSEWSTSVPSYRGIENPFGHINKWTDGFLGVGASGEYQDIYVCRDASKYSSVVTDDYVHFSDHEAAANGYCKAIVATDIANPAELRAYGDIFDRDDSGSASTYFCDYHYHTNTDGGVYGLQVGGRASDGDNAGLAYFYASVDPAVARASLGSRLVWSE